jgi:hypothetical protein
MPGSEDQTRESFSVFQARVASMGRDQLVVERKKLDDTIREVNRDLVVKVQRKESREKQAWRNRAKLFREHIGKQIRAVDDLLEKLPKPLPPPKPKPKPPVPSVVSLFYELAQRTLLPDQFNKLKQQAIRMRETLLKEESDA